jgi:hypothetical protein
VCPMDMSKKIYFLINPPWPGAATINENRYIELAGLIILTPNPLPLTLDNYSSSIVVIIYETTILLTPISVLIFIGIRKIIKA